jgi:hypothetical protein
VQADDKLLPKLKEPLQPFDPMKASVTEPDGCDFCCGRTAWVGWTRMR